MENDQAQDSLITRPCLEANGAGLKRVRKIVVLFDERLTGHEQAMPGAWPAQGLSAFLAESPSTPPAALLRTGPGWPAAGDLLCQCAQMAEPLPYAINKF